MNVFYRHNIAEKVSAMNIYMVFGGTSWAGIPMPQVGTSYDYSAPIGQSCSGCAISLADHSQVKVE